MHASTVPSFRFTKRQRAQKGDSGSGHWALMRRTNDQDRGIGRCTWQPRAVPAFDADWVLEDLDNRGAIAVIPPKANHQIQRNYDVEVYKWRHLVENYLAKIKEFRGIATRYDKTECSYAACWNLAAAIIASR
mmetsp:Transcript_29204/g.56465  ORF Transcript_29204/g.56465 Transcript_29204/m.56465 type:complete len:133 (-) Transcript_29204:5083-5481(-)